MPSTVHPEITQWSIHHFQTQMVEHVHVTRTAVRHTAIFPPIVTPGGKPLQTFPAGLHKRATVRHSDDGQIVLVVR